MSELGLHLSKHQLKLVLKLTTKFDLDVSKVTYSSGRSLIFRKYDKVYQIYLSDKLFNKVVFNLTLLSDVVGIIKYYNIYEKLNTIVYEYVDPIYNIHDNSINISGSSSSSGGGPDSFYADIDNILSSLAMNRLVHGDFCCDNIGYSQIQNRYVVYDLETARYTRWGDEELDRNRFKKSVKFCSQPVFRSIQVDV
jgi:hypothetical protein